MSRVQQLVSRSATPPFDIIRAAHVELHVTDLDAARHFYVDLLGLVVTEELPGSIYLRGWEERLHHSLVLRAGSTGAVGHLAFRVRQPDDLDRLAGWLKTHDCPAGWTHDERAQGRALRVEDPLGFPLEFFDAMEHAESNLQRYDIQRGAPVLRLDHFNLHVIDVERAASFWIELGFRCSEYISTDGPGERLTGAWLLRKPTVHDVGLTAGRGPRLHHIGMWVADAGGVLRACDQLAAAGYGSSIERGPGRHGVSNAFFVYLRDPDGHRIELYTCDYYTGDPDLMPLRWSVSDARCRSFWGTRAPDCWYEESSPLLSMDGRLVQTRDSSVDERSEVMA